MLYRGFHLLSCVVYDRVAQISPTEWIICGGMETEQYVSRKAYLLTYDPIVGSIKKNESNSSIKIVDDLIIYRKC